MKTQSIKSRRADQLAAHYIRCQALALECGHKSPNGKRIAVALLKLEREANAAATAQCNGQQYLDQPFRETCDESGEECDGSEWELYCESVKTRVAAILGGLPVAFRYNTDPRGYALKIDGDSPEGRALIARLDMVSDWGRNGILSPEIDGRN